MRRGVSKISRHPFRLRCVVVRGSYRTWSLHPNSRSLEHVPRRVRPGETNLRFDIALEQHTGPADGRVGQDEFICNKVFCMCGDD